MARLMSEAEQRRRQKLQSKIGRTTSTMGLTALGVTGAAAVAAKKPGALKAIQKLPGLKTATPKGMESAALKSGIVSGGIGGVGGFNQASIYSAESRRRKQAVPVKKDLGMEMGYYGEEGHPLTHEEIEAEIEKAWTPSASNFDSEGSRKKRADAYGGAALAGAGAGGAYAAHHGMKVVHEAKGIKPHLVAEVTRDAKGAAKVSTARANHYKAISAGSLKSVGRSGGKAAAGLAAVAGAAATHSAIKRKKQSSWQPYAKRAEVEKLFGSKGRARQKRQTYLKANPHKDKELQGLLKLEKETPWSAKALAGGKVSKSAFGVDHSDNPNGQHRETEN